VKRLHEAGAKVIAADVNDENLARVVNEFGVVTVSPGEIFGVRADIFSPCALGGVINDQTIPELRIQIVAGAANNQLLDEQHGEMLKERDILYVPDYVANVGGILNGCTEVLGWELARTLEKVDQIYDSVLTVVENAKAQGITTNEAANRIVEDRIRRARLGRG
jgi:leucine dehydrogenase